jgi:hypothetical protein
MNAAEDHPAFAGESFEDRRGAVRIFANEMRLGERVRLRI